MCDQGYHEVIFSPVTGPSGLLGCWMGEGKGHRFGPHAYLILICNVLPFLLLLRFRILRGTDNAVEMFKERGKTDR